MIFTREALKHSQFEANKAKLPFKNLFILLIIISLIAFFSSFMSFIELTPSLNIIKSNPKPYYTPIKEEKFFTYLPHSQFHNQLIELKNAIVLSYLTNRTLIIPPILHSPSSELAVPYQPLHELYYNLTFIETIKKNRSLCKINHSRKRYCSSEFSEYDSFIMINWEEIFDFSWIKNQIKIINRNDFSMVDLYKICNIPIKLNNNTLEDLLQDNKNVYVIINNHKYHYRFFDTDDTYTNDTSNKYETPYLISDLRKREEKLIFIDTLFGNGRIDYKDERIIEWKSNMHRSLKISHPILLDVSNNIVNELGGFGNYLGVHVRTADGSFKDNLENIIDNVIEQLKNYTQTNSKTDDKSDSINENISLNNCKLKNEQIIFIATDALEPRKKLSKIFSTFPCVFTIGDFKNFIDPLRNITYTSDKNVKMLNFFYPLLDLLIISNGMDVVVTHSSTFSGFAKYYHQILAFERDTLGF
ncbi:hypothetical protein C1645_734309 [Glomus cerebriforme]|uniref:CigA protein n=1 Tax=Glomus cerebriforme TaxID=658196 RepID=A0A397TA64_9GLOM|nr:hypothetical protein C1645_734309 [Glomus cerebriforme]